MSSLEGVHMTRWKWGGLLLRKTREMETCEHLVVSEQAQRENKTLFFIDQHLHISSRRQFSSDNLDEISGQSYGFSGHSQILKSLLLALAGKKKVTQSCPTLCNPMDCVWPARLLCPWDSPGNNTGVDSHSLLQQIFPMQGLNLGLSLCRQILYHLSHQGRPLLTLVAQNILSQFTNSYVQHNS